jgi:signal transduction histidine kinase
MWNDDQELIMIAEDNGLGFHPSQPHYQQGMGLSNMQTRARQLGAFCEVDAAFGRGTIVTLTMPLV